MHVCTWLRCFRVSTCGIEDHNFYCRGRQLSKQQHENSCSNDRYAFTSFVFDIFDFLTLEVVDNIQKVEMIMYNNVLSLRPKDVIYKRIEFFKKGLATQLIICLSFIYVEFSILKLIIIYYVNLLCLLNDMHVILS